MIMMILNDVFMLLRKQAKLVMMTMTVQVVFIIIFLVEREKLRKDLSLSSRIGHQSLQKR